MSLQAVIAAFGTGTYAVHRYGEGDWVNGRWVQGPTALTYADRNVDAVDPGEDSLSVSAHGLQTGDGPLRLTTTGALPTGLAIATDYWAIRLTDGELRLAGSLSDAMQMVPVYVTLSDAGTGVHTIHDVSGETERQNYSVLAVDCSVQEMSEVHTEDLPEGVSTADTKQLWTTTQLRPPTKPQSRDGAGADRIVIGGEFYVVWKVGYYGILSSHYKCTVVREGAWA